MHEKENRHHVLYILCCAFKQINKAENLKKSKPAKNSHEFFVWKKSISPIALIHLNEDLFSLGFDNI